MKWILNLSTRTKFFFGFGLMFLLLAAVIIIGFSGIKDIVNSQKVLNVIYLADIKDIKDIRSNQNAARADILEMSLLKKSSLQNNFWEDKISRENEDNKLMNNLLSRNKGSIEIAKRLKDFDSLKTEYDKISDGQVIPLIQTGKVDEAQKLIIGIQSEYMKKLRTMADGLSDIFTDKANVQVKLSEATANSSVLTYTIIGIISLFLCIMMAVFMNRIIANPIKELSSAANKIAQGDLTIKLSVNGRNDEIGLLMQSFRSMIENLRRITGEILEGVNVLSSSASEILASTTQVASGAAESAVAVNETTATIEEVKQTAQLANQKARYVSDTAQKTAQISVNGKKSVEQSIEGMNHVQAQMGSIAENIVRLSEQSQAIGEIITSVNDLADQSNLLAVNAAIEAAKAGEQGKGFNVVAQEIKNLAEQSKQATHQIKTILSDIQKAMSAAVLSTEQGTKAVEAGARQSLEAGESIKVLAESIAEASQAAYQIAASSQQQFAGMDQVTLAMENIKTASEQNVAGTKQSESAARNLHQLGQKLQELVSRFKV